MSELSILALLATMRLEAPLFVTIREAEVSGNEAVNDSVLFTGEMVSAQVKGAIVTAKAVSGGTLFDRKVPRVLYQRGCNNSIYDDGCRGPDDITLQSKWKFTASVMDPGVAGYPFEFVLEDLAGDGTGAAAALASVDENYFAGGWIEMGTGADWQRRAILLSSEPASGVMTVTLDSDPRPYPVIGDEVAIYPGCKGRYQEDCILKFGNGLNFIAHPRLPYANPSAVKPSQTGGGGKK
jgi:hypothetical protein